MEKREPRSLRVCIAIKPSILDKLKKMAIKHDLSQGRIIELLLKNWDGKLS